MARRLLGSMLLAGVIAVPAASSLLPMGSAQAQVLEVAVDQSPAGLDLDIATAFASFQIVNGTVYEGLTGLDKDLRVVPSLATSWTISSDGKTYDFKIRPGVTFHNGAPLEAADVVSSMKRVLSKDIGSPLASRLSTLASVTATDPMTVELKLTDPTAPLLASLATIPIVPRTFEADKDTLQRTPIGTGPFKFKEWQPNSYVLLTKNDAYWQKGLPKLDGIKFNIVPESATRQIGIASGQYSMLPNIDPATALQLKGKPSVNLQDTLEVAYSLVGMNVSKPPFDNVKVREAVNYALNRKEIITSALFGAGVPGGPLSPALKQWALDVSNYPCYTPDAAKAADLLKQSGLTLPISVSMLVLPRQDLKDIAQVAQQELNKVGFKVELRIPELGQFVQDWRNSNFDLFVSANGGSPDPDDYFYRTFKTGGSANVFKYSDSTIDALLDKARAETDPAQRKAEYDSVQKSLACDGPVAHIAYSQLFTAVRSNVQGFDIIANRSLQTLAATTVGK